MLTQHVQSVADFKGKSALYNFVVTLEISSVAELLHTLRYVSN